MPKGVGAALIVVGSTVVAGAVAPPPSREKAAVRTPEAPGSTATVSDIVSLEPAEKKAFPVQVIVVAPARKGHSKGPASSEMTAVSAPMAVRPGGRVAVSLTSASAPESVLSPPTFLSWRL